METLRHGATRKDELATIASTRPEHVRIILPEAAALLHLGCRVGAGRHLRLVCGCQFAGCIHRPARCFIGSRAGRWRRELLVSRIPVVLPVLRGGGWRVRGILVLVCAAPMADVVGAGNG